MASFVQSPGVYISRHRVSSLPARETRLNQINFGRNLKLSMTASRTPSGNTNPRFANKSPKFRSRGSSDLARNVKEPPFIRENPAEEMFKYDPPPPYDKIGKPPFEYSGSLRWREEDDGFWRLYHELDLMFRAPSSCTEEDFESPPQPLDRDGNPAMYPAAARYDEQTRTWVPTSIEEEEVLRNPSPVLDPYYVPEATSEENPTSMRIWISPITSNKRDGLDDSEMAEDDFTCEVGGYTDEAAFPDGIEKHRRRPLGIPPEGWKVVHLGTSSAVPTRKRNVSSTAFVVQPSNINKENSEPAMFLVDAGENTSRQLIDSQWCMTHGFRWIRAIFITHLHGDHIYGLPGLLTSIGKYAQFRRRQSLENGDPESEIVIHIFGPYGTRGFVRSSLFWTNPIGVRFCISELIPRETDFSHIRGWDDKSKDGTKIYFGECGTSDIRVGSGLDLTRECPPPHGEEVRAEDIHASEDGLWHVWSQDDDGVNLEVVAAPLRHRLTCFGYVFREPDKSQLTKAHIHTSVETDNCCNQDSSPQAQKSCEIDMEKARQLGVYGSQFRVLRSGRSVVVSKTGVVVSPEDVLLSSSITPSENLETSPVPELDHNSVGREYTRKVTILGDTCDSSMIAEAAMGSNLLIHEATFSQKLKSKAKVAMHSTALMAGAFARTIRARKLALTHFSSRYEGFLFQENNSKSSEAQMSYDDSYELGVDEEEDLANPNYLVLEAQGAFESDETQIVAAEDFMEHDIYPANFVQESNSASSASRTLNGALAKAKPLRHL